MAKDPARTTNVINKSRIDAEFLRNKLKLKSLAAKTALGQKYPHVEKFFRDKGVDLEKIREHSAKVITTGALAGTLLLAPPALIKNIPTPMEIAKSMNDLQSRSPDVTSEK